MSTSIFVLCFIILFNQAQRLYKENGKFNIATIGIFTYSFIHDYSKYILFVFRKIVLHQHYLLTQR